MIKNLFLTVLLILVALAIFVVVGTPKLANSSAGTFTPAPLSTAAPAATTSVSSPSISTPAAAPAAAPRRIGPGGKAVVARDAQMILEYGTWRVPAGTEVQIVEILGSSAKVRANGQEGTIVVSALQP